MKMEEEERMMRAAEEAALAHGGDASQLEPQDLSSETHNSPRAMEESEREPPLLMQSETQAAS